MRIRRLNFKLVPLLIVAMVVVVLPSLTISSASAAPVTLRVMSFNIWLGGTQVNFAKVVEAVRGAGADIVGVQEPGANLSRLASELGGWYHHAGQNVISRFPLVDPGNGDPYVRAVVAPGQAVAVSNVHLTPYPYGPYDLRDGATVAQVLANEQQIHMSEMASRFQRLPAVAASGMPVFLTGDFNVPSHKDWTDARRSDHRAVVATFTATPAPVPHSILTDDDGYAPGAPIRVDFTGPGNARDWVGIYRAGDTPGVQSSQYWKYVGGSQTPGAGAAAGSVTFDAASPGAQAGTWPPPAGDYKAYLLQNDGYTVLASTSFRVLTPAQLPTVSTGAATYRRNQTVAVNFANASGHAQSWVGIYPTGVTPGAQPSFRWAYLDGRTSGSVNLGSSASGSTWPLPVGTYNVFLFRDGGYVVDASASFRVRN